MNEPYWVLGLDPGDTTGLALYVTSHGAKHGSAPAKLQAAVRNLDAGDHQPAPRLLTTEIHGAYELCCLVDLFLESARREPGVVVLERYVIGRAQSTPVAVALEGAISFLVRRSGHRFVTYTASESKSSVSNAKLKALGWLTTPASVWEHANDATRLVVRYRGLELGERQLLRSTVAR